MRTEGELKVLTPEHVEIALVPAGLGSRFLAVLADGMIVIALGGCLQKVIGALAPLSVSAAATATLFFVVNWGYHELIEWNRYRSIYGDCDR